MNQRCQSNFFERIKSWYINSSLFTKMENSKIEIILPTDTFSFQILVDFQEKVNTYLFNLTD